ncbi:MAG TPA: hypothetical protein EYP43_02845, partial [Thermoplasmata archaeon]|nr:hypothetical protein [Thermoplasmata archaeon]
MHAHPESVCNPIIELLSREGFSIYHRTTTDEVTDIQLVRGAPVLLGEVEAVRILVQRREDGYHLSVQVAVYGKDIVRTLPNRIEILENAIGDVVRATDMSRHTVGIIGLGVALFLPGAVMALCCVLWPVLLLVQGAIAS